MQEKTNFLRQRVMTRNASTKVDYFAVSAAANEVLRPALDDFANRKHLAREQEAKSAFSYLIKYANDMRRYAMQAPLYNNLELKVDKLKLRMVENLVLTRGENDFPELSKKEFRQHMEDWFDETWHDVVTAVDKAIFELRVRKQDVGVGNIAIG